MRRVLLFAAAVLAAACAESPSAPDRPVTAVTLTPATSALILGQTLQLSAAITGGIGRPTVKWESSAPQVASVSDSGKVVALAQGSATISATAGSVTATRVLTIAYGAVDRVLACDRAQVSGCVSSIALPGVGTSAGVRASATNALGADVTQGCVFTWTPNKTGKLSISFFGDNTRRDALVTRSDTGSVSVIVACGGIPGIVTFP
jgi:hypothetical protein